MYEFDDKHDHVFGARCLYWKKPEHRESKFENPGTEAIWVGRSDQQPGSHLVVPIVWDEHSTRYVLGTTISTPAVDVDNTRFPLRSGPVDENDVAHLTDFESFIKQFEYQMYRHTVTDEDTNTQTDPGYDPILEVEQIVAKKGKGR